jgi:ElaB/YqjD/DUF883 family membrane-anchored ribosome-binding protein
MVMPDDNDNASRRPISDRLPDTEDLCGEIESYIKAKPFRAVAIALFVGLFVGRIIL